VLCPARFGPSKVHSFERTRVRVRVCLSVCVSVGSHPYAPARPHAPPERPRATHARPRAFREQTNSARIKCEWELELFRVCCRFMDFLCSFFESPTVLSHVGSPIGFVGFVPLRGRNASSRLLFPFGAVRHVNLMPPCPKKALDTPKTAQHA
jgi:hypothetical protein